MVLPARVADAFQRQLIGFPDDPARLDEQLTLWPPYPREAGFLKPNPSDPSPDGLT